MYLGPCTFYLLFDYTFYERLPKISLPADAGNEILLFSYTFLLSSLDFYGFYGESAGKTSKKNVFFVLHFFDIFYVIFMYLCVKMVHRGCI